MHRTALVLLLALLLGACGEDKMQDPSPGEDLGLADLPEGDLEPEGDMEADAQEDLAQDATPDVVEVELPEPAQDGQWTLGDLTVALEPAQASLRITDADGVVLLETLLAEQAGEDPGEDRLGGYAPMAFRHSELEIFNAAGAFDFERSSGAWHQGAVISAVDAQEQRIVATVVAHTGQEMTLTLALDERQNLEVTLEAPAAPEGEATLTSLSFACPAQERFYGLGSQSYAAEHRGWRVPMWTREQGIGKVTNPLVGFNGALEDAYAPMGWLASSRGYGLLLGTSERSVFELCSEREDAWRLETFAPRLRFVLLHDPEPKGLLGGLTQYTGRPSPPVPWTFAPWNDSLMTPERVLGLAALLRDNDIPASAMWVEDWIGGEDEGFTGYHLNYVWYPDRERWPDMEGMIGQLHEQGFQFLGYFNPFVRVESPMWQEALEGDFLVRKADGEPYLLIDPIFKDASLVDLTHPGALEWLRGYQLEAAAIGLDGWMADYAEWLPYDAVMHDGRSGAQVHNLYPLLWQQANRDNLEEAYPEGGFTFFARSGYAWTGGGTSGLAPVVWAGDQNTSWDAGDGIKTVVPIGLNLGMSGVGVFTHDIGGYASAITPPTTRELWFRWVELGAFSPVMRTHHGAKDLENWMLDRDEASLAHWKRYAIEHTRLYPYLMSLAMEAVQGGVPMFRHTALEFPQDPTAPELHYQYMLGDALLVAPVLEEGAAQVRLWLPEGRWASWWDGAVLEGPAWHSVDAELGEIPVFLRAGALVPRLLEAPDTLAPASAPGVTTLESLGSDLELLVFAGASSQRSLEDGAALAISAQALPEGLEAAQITVNGQALEACGQEPVAPCAQGGTLWLEGAELLIQLGQQGPELSLRGQPRAWRVHLVGF